MSLIPQKKTVFGETSVNAVEMNHASPSKKSLIPSGSMRKTNIPDNKSSILLKKSKVDNSVSRLGAAVDKSSVPGLQVAVRVRPLNSSEKQRGRVWKALNKYSSITQTTRDGEPLAQSERVTGKTFFTYDKSFGENTSTDMVYESVAKGIVNSVVSGVNGTVFAYGQTSSGKTYTMQGAGSIADGAKPGAGGIIHMAAKDIFRQIAMTRDRNFVVKASFLEIYNEEVRDLLSDDEKTLSIRENGQKGVFVECEEITVTDAKGLVDVIHRGEQSRMVASTAMNERSSRSHTIIRVTVESTSKFEDKENMSTGLELDTIRRSTLSLVDLAGSESVRLTGATADRQKEGGMINQSLLALSRVVSALGSSNQSFVNFRDSKLTRILQSTLSGNSKISFICCITPSEGCLEETRSTLQFASRAKRVKVQAEVNEVVNDSATIERLQRQLTSVQQELQKNDAENSQKLAKALLESKNALRDLQLARSKNQKIQRLIASSEHFFGAATDSSRVSSKRRLSESDMFGTPRKTMKELAEPQSDSRVYKQSRVTKAPSRDFDLLLATLRAKDQRSDERKSKLSQVISVLQSTDYELKEALGDNELMSANNDRSNSEMSWLSSKIQVLQSELALQDEALKTKESSLRKITVNWQDELSRRHAIEQEVERLMGETRELHEQLDNAKRMLEAEKASFDEQLAQMTFQSKVLQEEKNSVEAELLQKNEHLEELKSSLVQSDEQLKRFRSMLFNAGFERDQLLFRNQHNSLLISELQDSIAEHECNLEHMIVALRAVREELCEQGERNQALEDQVTSLEASENFLKSELSKQKSELEKACSQNDSLKQELFSSNSLLNTLQERVTEQDHLMQELDQKAQKCDQVMSDYEEASLALADAEDMASRVKKELDEQTSKCKLLAMDIENSKVVEEDLQKSLEDKSHQLDDLKEKIILIQNEIKEKDEQLTALRDDNVILRDATTHSNNVIVEMERKIADVEHRSDFLESSLSEIRIIEEQLRAELESKKSEQLQLASDYESKETEIREALLKLQEVQRKYDALSADLGVKEEQLERLGTENVSLYEELNKQSLIVDELKHSEASLKEELCAFAVKIEEITSHSAIMQEQLEKHAKLDAESKAEREIRELVASNNEESISTLESELAEAKDKLQSIEQEIKNAQATEEQLRNELEEKHTLIKELRNQRGVFESSLLEKESALLAMGEKLEESKSEAVQLKGMIQSCNKRCHELEALVTDQTSKLEMQNIIQKEQASALEEKAEEIKEFELMLEVRSEALQEAEQEMRMLNNQQNMQIQQIMQLETELDEAQEREKELMQQIESLQSKSNEQEIQAARVIAEPTETSAPHSLSFTPFPPVQESSELSSIVSGIKCCGEVTTWTCRLCNKEDSSIHEVLSEKEYTFDWLRQRDASASQLRALATTHAENEGHELLWNFAKKDNIEDQILYLSRGALGARWALLQSADVSTFEEFQNDVAWPPKSPSGLLAYSVKRFARAEGILLQASAHMFKKISGGKAVASQIVRDDCRVALQIHYQALLRAVESNWDEIQTLSSQEVFVRIQDILVGGHYVETILYAPSDEDSQQIFR